MEQLVLRERGRNKRKRRRIDGNWLPSWKKLKDVWYELAVIVNTLDI
jgi:hypothetical protein